MPSEIVTADPRTQTFEWGQQALFAAFAQGTSVEGMIYSGVLFVLVFLWTAIGLWFTIFLDIIFATLFMFNLARAIYHWWRGR
ncbi:hypothetical protein [Natronocalculus amylovorans]|uniref:Uncharacterized protein n=1 Tax=Natronocalculus amylovorans TaxID=2917812 RepID=A0AAE3FZZ3_9EURY|nr:hypothetical protein [Natronocalculus amylovorans]MCL9818325.1 hypothetical protein [Natronocalculus amylovorans]